jgi:hypothetical protein
MRRTALGLLAVVALASAAFAARPDVTLPPELSPDDRARLRQLTERSTVSGQVQGKTFQLQAGVFEYLLDHPEFATHVTRMLHVGGYRVWREPDGMWLDDGDGALGRFSVMHAAPGARVVHLRGRYVTRYLPAIHGEALAVLEYTVRPAALHKALITPTLTGFVKIDNVFVETLSRVMSGTARTKAERLARRVVGDFAETAEKIEANPAGVLAQLRQRADVPARELDEFRRLLGAPAGS